MTRRSDKQSLRVFKIVVKSVVHNAALVLGLSAAAAWGASPSIEITNVPPYGSFSDLGGRVLNIAPSAYRVAVFIFVPGAGWYSKPLCNPQLTTIQPDSSWTADVTTGGSDQFATKFVALLVSTNYNQPCVQGLTSLPANVTSAAVASAAVDRYDPSIRTINFSGYDWWVKSGAGLLGPGPNYFSDSTNNVWLDTKSQLHLRITNRSNQWQCAEIVTRRTFGYGSYRFELVSSVNDINVNAVLGMFTWSDDPAYANREIDIECSRWGNAADINNAQFVVQPFDIAGHLVRYRVPSGQTNSSHAFTWETNKVSFQCQRGSFSTVPSGPNLITNWVYSLDVPHSGDENVRINLWLVNGNPPAGNIEVECVIKSFEFVPLGPPIPALLTSPRFTADQFQFSLAGQMDRHYQVENSSNALDWVLAGVLLGQTNQVDYTETNKGVQGGHFYRAIALP